MADLVIPIPNFVPNNNIGLQGLINDAHQTLGYGTGGLGMPGPAVLVNDRGPNGTIRPTTVCSPSSLAEAEWAGADRSAERDADRQRAGRHGRCGKRRLRFADRPDRLDRSPRKPGPKTAAARPKSVRSPRT